MGPIMLFNSIMTLLRGGSVDPISVLMQILATLVIIFLVLPFHEFAHGWAANKLGDPTAKLAGRLTLQPAGERGTARRGLSAALRLRLGKARPGGQPLLQK
jgi:hypothetical protein